MGARTLVYHLFNLLAAAGLAALGHVSVLVPVAFVLMLADALQASRDRPSGPVRPPSGCANSDRARCSSW